MTTADCARWRTMLGADALGHLEERNRAALQAHLDGCPDCSAEALDLRRIESALRMVDPERIESMKEPDRDLERKILEQVKRERTRRSRRIRWAAIAAAFAIALGGTILRLMPSSEPDSWVQFKGAPSGVVARAAFEPRSWGTEIQLVVEGLPPNDVYSVWLEKADGSRVSSGSFRAVSAGKMTLKLSSGLSLGDATTIGVNSEGTTVMKAELKESE